jgi:hypothetical protein
MQNSRWWWLLVRVIAVGVVGAVSWRLLHVAERTGASRAAAWLEIAALIVAVLWPSRVLVVATLALPVGVAIARQSVVMEVAWILWSATVIGLASLGAGLGAPPGLPSATVRGR